MTHEDTEEIVDNWFGTTPFTIHSLQHIDVGSCTAVRMKSENKVTALFDKS